MKIRQLFVISLLVYIMLWGSSNTNAQCTMCKTNIENARKDGHTMVGSTLNNGIMYLLVLPYAIAGVFGFIYYKKYKERKAADAAKAG
ncbi:MAG: hypothetical protein H7296_15250 [Bacteroidia bacterium]|nr:hypothetical protein [Bacteroidia bacterium]